MKKYLPYLILLVLILTLVYFWQIKPKSLSDTNNTKNSTITVKVVFNEGQTTTAEYPYTEESPASLFKITKDIANEKSWPFNFKDYEGLGLSVEQIDSKINGDNNKVWNYYVDNKPSEVSVEKYFPKAGETIIWRFENSTY